MAHACSCCSVLVALKPAACHATLLLALKASFSLRRSVAVPGLGTLCEWSAEKSEVDLVAFVPAGDDIGQREQEDLGNTRERLEH